MGTKAKPAARKPATVEATGQAEKPRLRTTTEMMVAIAERCQALQVESDRLDKEAVRLLRKAEALELRRDKLRKRASTLEAKLPKLMESPHGGRSLTSFAAERWFFVNHGYFTEHGRSVYAHGVDSVLSAIERDDASRIRLMVKAKEIEARRAMLGLPPLVPDDAA